MTIPLPSNEELRLQSLIEYKSLDTPPETEFDDITRLAAMICCAPTALISFVDCDRQWFKSRLGLDVSETPRDLAFCAHTILNPNEVLIIEDATNDERFVNNKLVTDLPQIRFYAGAPLVMPDGFALGSLCVIDYVPRSLTNEQIDALKMLARQVVTQLELRRSKQNSENIAKSYRLLFENAPDGIHHFNFDGKILAVNSQFCEMTGRTEAELLQMSVEDLIPAEDLSLLPIRFDEMKRGKAFVSERRFKKANGELIKVELNVKRIDENTIQAIARDITERKRIKSKLLETERRYRDFLNSSLAFFCTHNLEGTISSVSPAAAATLGYTEAEIIGENLSKFVLPETQAILPHYFKELEIAGESHGLMRVLTKTGNKLTLSFSNILKTDSEGNKYVIGSSQNVSELKNKEEQLKKSQNLFYAFIDNSPAVIYLKNEQGQFEVINRTFEKLWKTTISVMEGKTDFDFLPIEIAEGVVANDKIVLETQQPIQEEEFVTTLEGEPQYWLSYKFPVTDEYGKKFVGGISININERKDMEKALESARDAALDSVRLKSAFLSNISHELRTPMNGVIGMTELLLETSLDRNQRHYTEIIRQSGDSLLTIIDDILDLSKIEAGKMRFESSVFDIRQIVESTVEMLAERANRKNLEIASFIDPKIPIFLDGDAGRLRQVLTNLIANAVKFTEVGEIGVVVKVEKTIADKILLRFSISDTGIGISAENMQILFQPFVQVDNSTTRNFGGTGLGLAISKQIVEMMNGEISAQSEIGKGSIFSFTSRFNQTETNRNKTELYQLPHSLLGKRILVADDKKFTREIFGYYLYRWNLKVETVASGNSLLEKLTKQAKSDEPFDLVVLGMNLPDWDSLTLAERIAADHSLNNTKIILTNSYRQRNDFVGCQYPGISSFLTKPVRGTQLFDSICFVLQENYQPVAIKNELEVNSILTDRIKLEVDKNEELTPLKNLSLLVVDDSETNRLLVSKQLEKIGITAEVAVDGVDALEKLAAGDFEIILMDCQMPRLDGYETTREIRRIELEKYVNGEPYSHISIIALTAHIHIGEREKCLAAGMDDYLPKPLKINDLANSLRYWIKMSKGFTHQSETCEAETNLTNTGEEIISLDELKKLYLSETSQQIEKIKEFLEVADYTNVERIAHAIRGNSLALGINDLAEKIEIVERIAREGDYKQLSLAFNSFQANFSTFQITNPVE